ncbi:MAG: PIN domain-containing protein [Bryobacterales bacterium]|nr:PIN domain-containing protein [Bryobacterales bacterium]MBV9401944.1 PIN domain-containing protein [Bryobacterales bacterium]
MIFVDAGPFLARHGKRDQYHREAERLWPTLEPPILTTTLVIGEFATLLGRQIGFNHAVDRVRDVYESESIDILQFTREDEVAALGWMGKYADHGIGFTDCLSFAMMRRHRIRAAFTFDRHFRDAGFEVVGLR